MSVPTTLGVTHIVPWPGRHAEGCVSHADDVLILDGRAVEACLRCGSIKAERTKTA